MAAMHEKQADNGQTNMEGSVPAKKELTTLSYVPFSRDQLDQAADAHGFHSHTGLVVDIDEARREFGDDIANSLKLASDGKTILWPQPTNRPDDPQNWSTKKKNFLLFVMTSAAFVPDFISSCGIASLFPLAAEFNTTTTEINNLTSNWSIFMLGWGGLLWIIAIKKLGRLPCLFWSMFFGLGWTIGCTVAPNLKTFAAMRILAATFQTAPQVSGLYYVTDVFPWHLQARKVNLWTLGFVISPFVGPSFLGFIVGQGITWRWVYGVGCIYSGIVLILIVLFMEETLFDRHLNPMPRPPTPGMRHRLETLIGITGWRLRHHRPSWKRCIGDVFEIVWKPQVILPLLYVMWVFGFGIGINVTNAVFVGEPRPIGYGLTANQQAGSYFSPVIGCLIGEFVGRYLNDWIAKRGIRKNHGVFEPEMRLWTMYAALPFFLGGECLSANSVGYGVGRWLKLHRSRRLPPPRLQLRE